MKEVNRERLSFAFLDKQQGLPELPPTPDDDYPLPAWYRSVRETPLDELGLEDICKACRQQIHLEHIVPIALQHLQADPLAGETFDGELVVALRCVPREYWPDRPDQARALVSILDRVLSGNAADNDVRQDVEDLLTKVAAPPAP